MESAGEVGYVAAEHQKNVTGKCNRMRLKIPHAAEAEWK